jgi:hypothetical protein
MDREFKKFFKKFLELYFENLNFKNVVDYFLDNGTLDRYRLEKILKYWTSSPEPSGDFELGINYEFINCFTANMSTLSREDMLSGVYFLLNKYRASGDLPPMHPFIHFVFGTTSLNEVVEEKYRLKLFFEKIDEFMKLLEEARVVGSRLRELIGILKIIENQELSASAPEVLKKEDLWSSYLLTTLPPEVWPEEEKEKLEFLKYYYPTPLDWVRSLNKVKKILKKQ